MDIPISKRRIKNALGAIPKRKSTRNIEVREKNSSLFLRISNREFN
jgi:hypothetical protein